MKEHPNDLSVEEILVRSSNVGSVLLAKEIGKERYKNFIEQTELTKKSQYRTGGSWGTS